MNSIFSGAMPFRRSAIFCLATSLEVEQANSSYEQTRAQLPSVESALQQSLNRLAVLTGQPPGALNSRLIARKPSSEG